MFYLIKVTLAIMIIISKSARGLQHEITDMWSCLLSSPTFTFMQLCENRVILGIVIERLFFALHNLSPKNIYFHKWAELQPNTN